MRLVLFGGRARCAHVAWIAGAGLVLACLCACAAPASGRQSVAELVKIVADASRPADERAIACRRLRDFGAEAKPAVPALIKLIKDPDVQLRDRAITTLYRLGRISAPALPALRLAAKEDPSEDIRSIAAYAIEQIEGAPAETGAAGRGTPTGGEAAPPQRRQTADPPARPDPRVLAARARYDMSFMAAAFPELATMPPPAWVKPGLKLTYYTASATIAGKGPIFQLDPQGEIFANDGSGRRYSVKPGSREEGLGGDGFGEFHIAAVEPGAVALGVDVYTNGAGGPPVLMSRTAIVGAPAAAADLWVSPAWLKQVPTGMGKHLRVLRTPYKSGSATLRAVAFSSADGTMVFVYDEATGVLLYRAGSGEGEKGLNLRINGVDVANQPSRMLTMSRLLGRTSPPVPGRLAERPGWLASVRGLHYSGQVGYVVPGSPNIPMPMSLDFTVVACGASWARFRVALTAGGAGGAMPVRSEEQWMVGAGRLGGLWIAPSDLAGLSAGQELESDPMTRVKSSVSRIGRGPTGGEVVVISRVGPTQRIDLGYDRASGVLVTIEEQRRGPAGTLASRLALRQAP
jgi:hypothetical protein